MKKLLEKRKMKLKNRYQGEKGGVTLFVLIAMLFFLMIGVIILFSSFNSGTSQKKDVEKIRSEYNTSISDSELNQAYEQAKNGQVGKFLIKVLDSYNELYKSGEWINQDSRDRLPLKVEANWPDGIVNVQIIDKNGDGIQINSASALDQVRFEKNTEGQFQITGYVDGKKETTINVNIDLTAPVITKPSGGEVWAVPGETAPDEVVNRLTVTDNISGVKKIEYAISNTETPAEDAEWKEYVNGQEIKIDSTMAAGDYYILVKATDVAGNVSDVVASGKIQVRTANYSITTGSTTDYAETLAEVMEKANEASTTTESRIKVLKDVTDSSSVTVKKNIVFDNNGKTITKTTEGITVNAGATLEVAGSGTITTTENITMFTNYGTLNITHTGTISDLYTGNNRPIVNHGTLNKTGSGTITSATAYTTILNSGENVTATISAGTVLNTGSSQVIHTTGDAILNVSGTAYIRSTNNGSALTLGATNGSKGFLNMTGGTVISDEGIGVSGGGCEASRMNISGGTVTGKTNGVSVGLATATITGGNIIGKTGSAIGVSSGTLILGNSQTALNTESPIIASEAYYGVNILDAAGKLYFYDGKIIGGSKKTVNGKEVAFSIATANNVTYRTGCRPVTETKTENLQGGGTKTYYETTLSDNYTVTANANGGTIPTTSGWTNAQDNKTATKTVKYNTAYGTLPEPTKAGYNFKGWFTEAAAGTQVTATSVFNGTSDPTLYAHWADETAPVITSANPSTEWDIENFVDFNATDAGSGVVAYNITETNTAPTNWIPVVSAVEEKTETKYDKGAAWARVFHHNTHWGSVLFSSWAEAKNTESDANTQTKTIDKYSVLENLDKYKNNSNVYEFLLQYPDVDATKYNRWRQTDNPATTTIANAATDAEAQNTFAGGYTTEFEGGHIDWTANYWGGLTLSTYGSSFINGSVGHGNWFYAIGSKSRYNGGIPGPNTSGVSNVNLWARIDDKPTTASNNLTRRIGELKENKKYYVWVKDEAGNTTSREITIGKVDTTAPTASITAPANASASQTVTLTLGDDKQLAKYYWGTDNPEKINITWLDVAQNVTTSTSLTQTVTEAGKYYLGVQDAAGNRRVVNKTFYNLTLNVNGGSSSNQTKLITPSQKYGELFEPVRTGYTFKGWFTDATAGTQVTATSVFNGTADQTLYAHWEINKYNMTFDKNYLENDIYGRKPVDSLDNSNWTRVASGASTSNREFVENLSAKYGKEIQFTMGDGKAGVYYFVPVEEKLEVGKKYTWSVYVKSSVNKTLQIGNEQGGQGNYDVTTEWQRITKTFTVTDRSERCFTFYALNSNPWTAGDKLYIHSLEIAEVPEGKDTALNVSTTEKAYGSALDLTGPTREGYTFKGWYTAPTGGTKLEDGATTPASNVTYYAQWEINKYYLDLNLTVDGVSNPKGYQDNSGGQRVYAKLVVDGVDLGYKNDYYAQYCYGTPYSIVKLKLDNEEITYNVSGIIIPYEVSNDLRLHLCTLSLAVNNSNYGTVNKSELLAPLKTKTRNGTTNTPTTYTTSGNVLTLSDGRTATATPTAKVGYNTTFSSWSPASGTISEPTTVTANFTRTANTYTVTADANGGTIASTTGWTGTGNSATKSVTFDSAYGDLPEVSRTGYTFKGWNGKNLLNMTEWLNSFSAAARGTVTKGENSVTLTATGNDAYTNSYSNNSNSYRIPVKPNTDYVLSWKSNTSSVSGLVVVFINGKTTSEYMVYVNQKDTDNLGFTTTSDAEYISFRVGVANSGESITYSNIMLEESDTATPYEPYYLATTTSVTTAKDHTINAKWTPIVYTISLDGQGATSTEHTTAIYEKYATGYYSNSAATTSITSVTIPSKTGFEFQGYYSGTNGVGTQYINELGYLVNVTSSTFTDNTTLYAKWRNSNPGLYDENDNLIKSWSELEALGLTKTTIETDYTTSNYNTSAGSPYKVFTDNNLSGKLVLPNTVTKIGNYSFYYCSNLTSMILSDSLISIGNCAFWECSGLATITIPDSVTSIGMSAFGHCYGLTTVTLPNSITRIEASTFTLCRNLATITIPDSVTSIEKNAFSNCSGLTTIKLSDNVTSIRESTFNNCSGLTTIIIPSSVISIEKNAFGGCSGLTTITIPSSVMNIEERAFLGCGNLISINVDSNNSKYDSRNNCNAIIETSTNILIRGCKNTVIPNDITRIGASSFNECSGLTTIILPNSVTSIGSFAFDDCQDLTTITIPESVTSIETYMLSGCTKLNNVTFNNPNGWYVSTSSTATSGTILTLTNTSQNATYLKSTYYNYFWKRNP